MNELKIIDALKIPQVDNEKIKYFVDGEFMGDLTMTQTVLIRLNVVKYIHETKDKSILNRFHFVGHEDSNDRMGKEVIITMDEDGNFSESPWEHNYMRRTFMTLMRMEREKCEREAKEKQKQKNNG